jgi:DNA repair exonuclease SbcCD ATPase subunit
MTRVSSCYNPNRMDESQFEAKLKQLKREKQEAEEELESSAEKWRSEKRRLNSEIDRLEGALVDAKAKAAKRPGGDGKTSSMDPAVIARIQAAAEEKLTFAAKEWEDERSRLRTQINRLEGAVAEAIERSSNPMRATQSVKERFEGELDRVAKDKTELEQAFLRAKTEWEQEKLKMTGELVKFRRAAQIMGHVVPREDSPEANPKVRALEDQLKESLARWSAEREKLVAQIQRLEGSERQWDTERRQLNDHAGQLQQAFVQAQAKIQGYEVAARAGNQYDSKLSELKQQKESLERELQQARDEWNAERRRLTSEVERRDQQIQMVSTQTEGVSSQVVDQLRKQYEQRLQDAITQKTQLAQELQSASTLLEAERARLSAEIGKGESKSTSQGGSTLDKDTIAAEVSRVEAQIQQIVGLIDDPETELSTVIRKNVEKAELGAYLKGILFSLGRTKGI